MKRKRDSHEVDSRGHCSQTPPCLNNHIPSPLTSSAGGSSQSQHLLKASKRLRSRSATSRLSEPAVSRRDSKSPDTIHEQTSCLFSATTASEPSSLYEPIGDIYRQSAPSCLLRCSRSLPNLQVLRQLPQVVPLSRQNLQAMSSRHPLTPDGSSKSAARQSVTNSSPSKASTTSTATSEDSGARMEWINIMGEDVGSNELSTSIVFREAVTEIVLGHRHSSMKPGSAQRFKKTLDNMKVRNEVTLAARLMPFLVKEDRSSSTDEDRRAFHDDGLDWNLDADFASRSVPVPADKANIPEHERVFGIRNPRPDVCFGFASTAFRAEERSLLARFDPEVSKGILSPFFAIQWKGSKGTINDAKIQVRRDGAAMVHARRKARQVAASSLVLLPSPDIVLATAGATALSDESSSATAADGIVEALGDVDEMLDTMAFSAAITPDVAFFYVHWAKLVDGDRPVWHMAIVRKFFMDDEDAPKIRATMHNIIDWGLDVRMRVIRRELAAYAALDDAGRAGSENQIGRGSKRRRTDDG